MGVVYKARDLRLGRVVALKMILDGARAGPADRELFIREARAVASLAHPGIVGVFEVGQHDGLPFMALEFVPGGTLAQRFGGNPQPPRNAARMLTAIAEAVDAAHRAGIVHRDLKPANILLGEDGRPKIGDFGLARTADARGATRPGEARGTLAYMSPEQAEGARRIGPPADVYALGAILYELLTGRPPLVGESEVHTVWMLISQDPIPPRQLQPKVPRDLETICLKCLAKKPVRRYQTAGALAADLRRFLNHQPILARPTGLLERAGKWAIRKPAVAALSAVSALATAALVGAAAYFTAQLTHERDIAERRRSDAEDARRSAETQRAEAEAARGEAERRRTDAESARAEAESARAEADVLRRNAEEAAMTVRRHLYAADLTLGWQAAENGRVARAMDLLARQVPAEGAADLRGFEWGALARACRPERFRLETRDEGAPAVAALSPDRRRAVTLSTAGVMRTWDLTAGQPRPLTAERAVAAENVLWCGKTLAFSPDGKRFAAAVGDKVLHVRGLDAGSGGQESAGPDRLDISGHKAELAGAVFTADGKRILSVGYDQTLRYWDAADGRELAVHKVPTKSLRRATFSADLRRLVTAGSAQNGAFEFVCWRLNPDDPSAAPQRVATGDPEVSAGQRPVSNILSADITPDGSAVVVSLQNEATIGIYDFETGRKRVLFSVENGLPPVAYSVVSPDGKRVALGRGMMNSGGAVEVWELADSRRTVEHRGHSDGITTVSWTSDGRELVSASFDGTVRVWSAGASADRWTGLSGEAPYAVWAGYSADGSVLATAGSDGILLLAAADLRPLAMVQIIEPGIARLALSPDGRHLAVGCADGRVALYGGLTSGGRRLFVRAASKIGPAVPAFSPDGATLAVGGTEGFDASVLLLRTADGGELRRLDVSGSLPRNGNRPLIGGIAFGRDGRTLAALLTTEWSNIDSYIGLYGTSDGRFLGGGARHPGAVAAMAFAGDGSAMATVCDDSNGRVWAIREGKFADRPLLLQGHTGQAKAVAVSPDGRRVATAAGREVKIWDASDGRDLATLHPGTSVRWLAFSPDGSALTAALVGDAPAVRGADRSAGTGGLRIWRADASGLKGGSR
jgi:WD40 repeat protein